MSLREKKRTVVATVETGDCREVASGPVVTNRRTVTLNFPDAIYGWGANKRTDFVKTFDPAEARALGQALIDAADEIDAPAEP